QVVPGSQAKRILADEQVREGIVIAGVDVIETGWGIPLVAECLVAVAGRGVAFRQDVAPGVVRQMVYHGTSGVRDIGHGTQVIRHLPGNGARTTSRVAD